MTTTKIAIACQGGGTHAAFTWGVLTQILETKRAWDAESGSDPCFDITALSGTSAGALCALATWYGLVPNQADPTCGTIDKAIERLDFLWHAFAAETPVEKSLDVAVAAMLDLKDSGAPVPEISPYQACGDVAIAALSLLGARQEFLSFPGLLKSLCPDFEAIDWSRVSVMNRRVLAGAVEVISGNFEVFDSHKTLEEKGLRLSRKEKGPYPASRWRMRRPLSLEGVAASGTLPEVLKAQRIPETEFPTCSSDSSGTTIRRDACYWDGLYSQNPPVRLLLDADSTEEKPNEIWVIRINPQEMDPGSGVRSLEDIKDRQNELAGNLSLNSELDHILTVNNWLSQNGSDHPALRNRQLVEIRTIKMRKETAWGLRRTSKFHRSREHLEALRIEGREVAEEWLAGWRARGENFGRYPDDAGYRANE